MVNGWSLPDIGIAAALAASTSHVAVLYTELDPDPEATRQVMADYRPARIVIIGGTTAVSQAAADAIAAADPDATLDPISGQSRTQTAAAVRQLLTTP